MPTQIVSAAISRDELRRIAEQQFGDFVKAVVDVQRQLMAIGAELHADEEAVLMQDGRDRETSGASISISTARATI